MNTPRVCLLGLAVFLFMLTQGLAEEHNPKERLKEILKKKKAGQELTVDEREFLEKNARFLKKQRPHKGNALGPPQGPRFHQPAPPDQLQTLLTKVNVVDRAALSAVRLLWKGGQRDDAVALAEKIIGKTPDPDAAGLAHLILGRFLTELEKKEEADKHLRAVTGRAASLAMVELAEPLMKAKDVPGLLAAFKDLVASQKSGLDRCRVVKALLEQLERPIPDALPPEQYATLLQAVADSIPYEEALAAKEALAKEEPLVPAQPQAFGPGRGGPGQRGGPPMPPEIMERFRAVRELPPDQRHQAIDALMKEVAVRAGELHAEGRVDEARRLKMMLERHEQMKAKMKDVMMKRGKGGGMMPPRDPDAMRKEIDRLEDQGFKEEADKLRRELEAQQRGQAVDEKF